MESADAFPNGVDGVGIDDDSFAARPSNIPAVHVSAHSSIAIDVPSRPSTSASMRQKTSLKSDPLGDVLVISGGSGYNELVGATPGATYVMPISDDGGSSSEIIRVLGGPSIGDIRSRLVRMIPTSTSFQGPTAPPPSNDALHALLAYRLPTESKSRDIKQEWRDILEGRHSLWRGIEPERKECIRGFLVYFESEILRRVHRNFDFRGGSIGNFFLAAAQKFFRSIQSAIFFFSATALIPSMTHYGSGKVIPVINTNHTATIGAILEDGRTIVGQCEISHPAASSSTKSGRLDRLGLPRLVRPLPSGMQTPASVIFDPFQTSSTSRLTVGNLGDGLDPGSDSDVDQEDDEEAGGTSEGNNAANEEPPRKKPKRHSNLVFSKEQHSAAPSPQAPNGMNKGSQTNEEASSKADSPFPLSLGSRIARLFYVNAYGNEVDPAPNPEYLARLRSCQTLLYSCGSLWTSIVPCLALRGVASAISTSDTLRYKILLLNTSADRETSGLDAIGFVRVLATSMRYSDQLDSLDLDQVVTHIVYCPRGGIPINVNELEALGIRCIPVSLPPDRLRFDEKSVRHALDTIVHLSDTA